MEGQFIASVGIELARLRNVWNWELIALQYLQFVPVARVVTHPLVHSEIEGFDLRRALAAVSLMLVIDSLLNCSMILPLLLLMGD